MLLLCGTALVIVNNDPALHVVTASPHCIFGIVTAIERNQLAVKNGGSRINHVKVSHDCHHRHGHLKACGPQSVRASPNYELVLDHCDCGCIV